MDALIAVIGVLGVAVGAIITGWFQQRKNKASADKDAADANEQIRSTVMSLIEPLNQKIDRLERENRSLKHWAEQLVCQVKERGGIPVPYVEMVDAK